MGCREWRIQKPVVPLFKHRTSQSASQPAQAQAQAPPLTPTIFSSCRPHTAHTAISVYSHLSEPLFDAASAWIYSPYTSNLYNCTLVPANTPHSPRLSLFQHSPRSAADPRRTTSQPPATKTSQPHLPPLPHLPERRLTPQDASPPLNLSDRRHELLSHMLLISTATTTTAAPRSTKQPHSQRTDLSASGTYYIPTNTAN